MPGHLSHATDLGLPIVDPKSLHHNPNKNALLTMVSNFPGRRLPPTGAQPTALDCKFKLDFEFKVNNSVLVRHFDEERQTWTIWRQGVVLELVHIQYPLGCRIPGYRVRCTVTNGLTSDQIYRPFLGEICRAIGEYINISPALCISWLEIAMQAYARINSSAHVQVPRLGKSVPIHEVWIKSKIMSWNEGQPPQVMMLDGPFEGKTWPALELLPYNPKTGIACHERGECVMAPGGEIIPGETDSYNS